MKITRRTPQQLILEDRPYLAGVLIILAIVGAAGFSFYQLNKGANPSGAVAFPAIIIAMLLYTLLVYVRLVMVIFDRANNSIEIREQSVFGFTKKTFDLSSVKEAAIDTKTKRNDDGFKRYSYRPALLISDSGGEITQPLIRYHTNNDNPERTVNQINEWLTTG